LHVSQISSEISRIARWTGRFRICVYCTKPKTIPRTQIRSPQTRRLCPVIPRNETVPRSGIFSSASLADATDARKRESAGTAIAAADGAKRLRRTSGSPAGLPDVRDQARARHRKTIAEQGMTMTPPCMENWICDENSAGSRIVLRDPFRGPACLRASRANRIVHSTDSGAGQEDSGPRKPSGIRGFPGHPSGAACRREGGPAVPREGSVTGPPPPLRRPRPGWYSGTS
jgi:hypothetical protein